MNRHALARATVRCPECKARKGQPCVYLSERFRWRRDDSGRWSKMFDGHRIGEPIPGRTHVERLARLRERERADRAAEIEAARPRPTSALESLRAFDGAETMRLRDWLAEFGPILWGAR